MKPVVHFLHIGKTGGTAIKQALAPWQDAAPYHIVLHKHHVRLSDIPEGDLVFFALRDPVKRFVSGFNSRLRIGRPRHNYPWSEAEARAFSRFQSPNHLAETLSSSDQSLTDEAMEAMQSIQHVRDRFVRWLQSEQYLLHRRNDILCILRQETLDADFDRLLTKLELRRAVTLPSDPIECHRTPPGMSTRLSRLAEKNLRQYYCEDYELLKFAGNLRAQLQ